MKIPVQFHIEWAVGALVDGKDSPSLRILAGLDENSSSFEVEEYYRRARRELSLPEPTEEEALREYAVHLSRQILEPGSDFEKLAGMLHELCWTNHFPEGMMGWFTFVDSLWAIKNGESPDVYEPLYGEDDVRLRTDPRGVAEELARKFILENEHCVIRPNRRKMTQPDE